MTTRSFWNQLSLVAVLGVACLGCKVTAESSDASTVSKTRPCTGAATATSGPTGGPCDIYADDGGLCIAAHSTVRALFAAYDGPLYQVRKTADGSTQDIGVLTPGGYANAAAQDTFCGVDACTISIIYDQSGMGNHLTKAPGGGAKTTPDNEANAKSAPATFNGHAVYGVHIVAGVGYRNNGACGTATGDNPETEYMVVAGTPFNNGCCFDYGNMETTSRDDGEGTMEAVYFGNCTIWGKGADNGPWVMGDLENGLWAGSTSPYDQNVPVTYPYVTGMVKGDVAGMNHWAIKTGNAQSGMLTPTFDGQRPSSHYNPMRKEGGIGLGTGGDNSNVATGNWFEGVMTTTYSTDKADDAVQANIVSVYGGQ
jgi:non-reducing end alpha-L-arabinofuranosidase